MNSDHPNRPQIDATEILIASSRIYFDATNGKHRQDFDPKLLRQSAHSWIVGALEYLGDKIPDELKAPGLFLLSELEGLDRGRVGRVFEKRFEEPWDEELLRSLELTDEELPERDTERAGAPGKGSLEIVRDGTAAAVIDALVTDGWKAGDAVDHIASTLGLNRDTLNGLRKRLSAARGKGKAHRDRETFRIYRDTLDRLLRHQEQREVHAMMALKPFIALRGLPPER